MTADRVESEQNLAPEIFQPQNHSLMDMEVGFVNHLDLDQKKESESERLSVKKPNDINEILDTHSFESLVEQKISRFLEQLGSYYPEDLHSIIIKKVEKPLLHQILRRTGGNQVHAAKILGINRNTLRKKMKMYGFA